jgi:hypothetical protein
MNTNIQLQTLDALSADTLIAPPAFVPDIKVGAGICLLEQMDNALMRGSMQRHAMQAFRRLASLVDEDPVTLELIVGQLAKLKFIHSIDQKDPDSVTNAVASAAILKAIREGNQTALEKIEVAMSILSGRYQADW